MSAEIRSIHVASNDSRDAEQELLDYMLWTMKHDQDPHALYDDPIEIFREEMKARRNVA